MKATDKREIKLPPFKVKHVVSTLSQVHGWGITQLNIPETWKITRGEDITVMVIDTGYTNHNDLKGALIQDRCKSFISSEKDIDDHNGHSTHCIGVIAARDNDIGMVGVAPKCNVISVKVLGADGSGDYEGIRNALRYAIKIQPHVISMSLGAYEYDSELHKLVKKLYSMNIPIIAAAGNDGTDNAVNYPGKFPETICVTAFDKNGNPADFNSTGKEADFSAPGVDIYSTWLKNKYASLSGTSMATPFMAGVVALLLSKHLKQELQTGKNDCKTVDQIKEHLKKYCDDKGISGHDDIWGYGVIDPIRLIYENTNSSSTITIPTLNFKQKIINWLRRLFW